MTYNTTIWTWIGLISILIASTHTTPLKPTTKCPCDIDTWSRRSQEFACSDGLSYTCILGGQEELTETCLEPYVLDGNKVGCPYLVDDSSGLRPRTEMRFSTCVETDCPLQDHAPYTMSELYLYKRCWVKEKDRSKINEELLVKLVCLPKSVSTNNDFTSVLKHANLSIDAWNNSLSWVNTTDNVLSAERPREFWFIFLLWLAGAMLMLLPMLWVLMIHKIRKKYKPCKSDGKRKKAKKRKKKAKKKMQNEDKSSASLFEKN